MYRVRVVGDNGYPQPIVRRFRSFGPAYKFARRWVNSYVDLYHGGLCEAVLTPNCCYVYPPEQGHLAGKSCLTITIVDEADDPVPFKEEVPPNGWS